MGIGKLEDDVWLHTGRRLPAGIESSLGGVPGIVLQGPLENKRTQAIWHSPMPVALQHHGDELPASLFGPDHDWLLHQVGAAVYTSRLDFVAWNGSGSAGPMNLAVSRINQFLRLVAGEDPAASSMGLIAVDARWFRSRRDRRILKDALAGIDGSVGILLGGTNRDPLDDVRIVEGMVEVIGLLPSVAVLRCDHGALGMFSFGAAGCSIGLGTGARHYIPTGAGGGADHSDLTPRIYWPFIQGWWKGSAFAQIGEIPLLDCPCATCGGRSLARFDSEESVNEAAAHSISCWRSIASELKRLDSSARQARWLQLCEEAYRNLEILEDDQQLLLPPSKQLKAWLRFAGVPAV